MSNKVFLCIQEDALRKPSEHRCRKGESKDAIETWVLLPGLHGLPQVPDNP